MITTRFISKLEEAAERMQELDNSDDKSITMADAAKEIGVHYDTVKVWAKEKKIPCEIVGSRKFIKESVVNEVISLREQFGSEWSDHVNWIVADDDIIQTVVEMSEAPESSKPLAVKIAERGKELAAVGKYEAASELFAILIDHCDWSSL